MPSGPRVSASTLPSAVINQPRKLLVPQSTATKAGLSAVTFCSGLSWHEFVPSIAESLTLGRLFAAVELQHFAPTLFAQQ
jgi:hypothetical protein